MRIRVDAERCIGAGQCVRWAPRYFDQDEETGIVKPVGRDREFEVDASDADPAGAVRACPSGAVRLIGDEAD
ncbi:ferredoxin [Kineosporia sp. J2-2]|uniref:Ferredoxin n=1 Tax=Kineosporia corallincola TaxID=2835133 RepID=A0ABS5TTA6_9ACTN|nr:ferredoxin [Kineosporia corallincola]MBT0774021.1 ferredoxin [Kineosporia corallincola]